MTICAQFYYLDVNFRYHEAVVLLRHMVSATRRDVEVLVARELVGLDVPVEKLAFFVSDGAEKPSDTTRWNWCSAIQFKTFSCYFFIQNE